MALMFGLRGRSDGSCHLADPFASPHPSTVQADLLTQALNAMTERPARAAKKHHAAPTRVALVGAVAQRVRWVSSACKREWVTGSRSGG